MIELLFDRLKGLKTQKCVDRVDVLYYRFSPLLFLFLLVVAGLPRLLSNPVDCMPIANHEYSFIEYTNNYCYSNGTYYTHSGSDYDANAEKFYVKYYQYAPYSLIAQAFSFYFFYLMHVLLISFTLPGLKLQGLLDRCSLASTKNDEGLNEDIAAVAKSIYTYSTLKASSVYKMKTLGNGMAYGYILSKCINVMNLVVNIYFLNEFIGLGDKGWAFTIIQGAYTDLQSNRTGAFPRITYCDVPLKGLGQMRTHTVQCVLKVNYIFEMVFVVAYFWLLMLLIITAVNLVWSAVCILLRLRSPLDKYSKPVFDGYGGAEIKYATEFVDFMALNGQLLIRFVDEHAGSVTAHKLVMHLTGLWKANKYPVLGNDV